MATFTMNTASAPAPAGLIRYGCRCRTITVIHLRHRSWILKRCGRVLITEGGTRTFTAQGGDLVGRHLDGTTRTPFRALEWFLHLCGHAGVAVAVMNETVKHPGGVVNMRGHRFTFHRFNHPGHPTGTLWAGKIIFPAHRSNTTPAAPASTESDG